MQSQKQIAWPSSPGEFWHFNGSAVVRRAFGPHCPDGGSWFVSANGSLIASLSGGGGAGAAVTADGDKLGALLLSAGWGAGAMGDITGGQGQGGGGRLRPCGSKLYGADGPDLDSPVFEDKRDFEQWTAEQAAGVGAVSWADSLGERLLDLGRRVSYAQVRRVFDLRGVQPSETSRADAASAAVLSVLVHVRGVGRLSVVQWSQRRVLRVLWLYASRGAFKDLAAGSSLGMAGRGAGRPQGVEGGADLDALPGAVEVESVQASRLAAIRWVYSVGLHAFKAGLPSSMAGAARAASIRGAVGRVRSVARVILGNSLEDSVCAGGFSTVKAFAQSCQASGFFASLADARARDGGAGVEVARVAQRRYALEAAAILRKLSRMGAGGWDCARLGTKASGGAVVVVQRLRRELSQALDLAVHYKRVADANRRADATAFDRVLLGVKSGKFGNLRSITGLTTKRKGGGRRLDSVQIGAAKGKLTVPASPVGVSASVGRRKRKVPCVPVMAGAVVPLVVPLVVPAVPLSAWLFTLPGGAVMRPRQAV